MLNKIDETDRSTRRSRRQVLALGAAAMGALAASMTRVEGVKATQGSAIIAGQVNTEVGTTTVVCTTSDMHALDANASGSGAGINGLGGENSGPGVIGAAGGGNSGQGSGVVGYGSGTGAGVVGVGGYPSGPGVSGGPGVTGSGSSPSGDGVQGFGGDPDGGGVLGVAAGAGTGVYGNSAAATGVGVLAENTGGGKALRVSGVAAFSRSGVATIKSGAKTAVVNSVHLTSASLVIATMQNVLPGVMVQAVAPDPVHSKFTINLNKAPLAPAIAKVGWFVVN